MYTPELIRTFDNGIQLYKTSLYGGNVEYEAKRNGVVVAEYHVERYHPSDGNYASLNGKDLNRPDDKYEFATYYQWIAAIKSI